MPTVRSGPAVGLAGQVALVMALTATVGLGAMGELAAIGYGVAMYALLVHGLRRAGSAGLGPADVITLTRATLVGGVTGLVVDSFVRPAAFQRHAAWLVALVTLTCVALALDAVDGKVARRTRTVSAFGARFDMEVDAFLIMVLSWYVSRPLGSWVLAIGAMRYAFVAAGWAMPWLRGSLEPKQWRKVVAATQGIVLAVAAAGVLPRPMASALVAASLALLAASFSRDVTWLWTHRQRRPALKPAVLAGV